MFANCPSLSIVDRMSKFELVSICSEVLLPIIVSLENIFPITSDILGNVFLVKFFTRLRKNGRILMLDFRFCLSISFLKGSKHF